ncbi:SIMPL domain-containing protein OS=Streptomyces alboniger OX=132473 GN=CP975_08705 PE=4 SV=1 [Streptomyces alboniger]
MELADIGAENAPAYPAASGGRMRSMAYGAPQETAAAPLDLEPQRQHVHAQVNARFTMAPPQL